MARLKKVTLYVRARSSDGRDKFLAPAWNRNRTLRACYALVAGQAEYHPEANYYLRYLESGKRVWQNVGPDADAALVALRNAEHDQQAVVLGRSASALSTDRPVENHQPDSALSLESARDAYLVEVKRSRSEKTIAACEHMLKLFCEQHPASWTSSKLYPNVVDATTLDHLGCRLRPTMEHDSDSRKSSRLRRYAAEPTYYSAIQLIADFSPSVWLWSSHYCSTDIDEPIDKSDLHGSRHRNVRQVVANWHLQ